MLFKLLTSTISSKGQVTIPLEVRRRLGLQTGDQVEFVFEGGQTVVKPLRTENNPFLEDIGKFPGFQSTEDINAWISEMRDETD